MKKRIFIGLLKAILITIGLATFVLMLWEPLLEGRNTNASLYEIYFQDIFLAYVYLASTAYYVALYQLYNLLQYWALNSIQSLKAIKALRTIKYCSILLILFILGAEIYFFTVQRAEGEDIAGGVALSILWIWASSVIGIIAYTFEKKINTTLGNR